MRNALPHRHLPEDLLRHRRFRPAVRGHAPGLHPLYARLREQASSPAGEVQAGDRVFQRGTGEGWLTGRRRLGRGRAAAFPASSGRRRRAQHRAAPVPAALRRLVAARRALDGDQSPHHPADRPCGQVHTRPHRSRQAYGPAPFHYERYVPMKRTLLATALFRPGRRRPRRTGGRLGVQGRPAVDPKSNNGTLAGGAEGRRRRRCEADLPARIFFFAQPRPGSARLPCPSSMRSSSTAPRPPTPRHPPPTVSVQWHFNPGGKVNPFVGLGLNYTTFFSVRRRVPGRYQSRPPAVPGGPAPARRTRLPHQRRLAGLGGRALDEHRYQGEGERRPRRHRAHRPHGLRSR